MASWLTRISGLVRAERSPSPNPFAPTASTTPALQPQQPRAGTIGDLGSRNIHNDPRDLWYLSLPSKLTPNQVLQLLRAAMGGDLWQLWQLESLMLDSWPMLRKCQHELREAVSQTTFIAKPYAVPGKEPSAKAKAKADLVNRAMNSFVPDQFTDEKAFTGFIYDVADAMLLGVSMVELIWSERPDGELLPRASAWVHPSRYTFGDDGRIRVLTSGSFNVLRWGPERQQAEDPDPNKYICAQFTSRSGSALGAGLIRPLAWYWSGMVYNREWMLQFAQTYGQPFLDCTYTPGMQTAELQKLQDFLAEAGQNKWLMRPAGTNLQIEPAGSLGPDNPHRAIVEQANEACQLMFLGQTHTTAGTPGMLGGSEEHSDVRRERVEGLAKWIAKEVLSQLARACVRVNWGDEDEVPEVVADFTEAMSPQEAAQFVSSVVSTGIPVHAEEIYSKLGVAVPEVGDLVIQDKKLIRMGEPADGQLDQELASATKEAEMAQAESFAEGNLRVAARKATGPELVELGQLVRAAAAAPHRNGELKALKDKLDAICNRN